MIWDISDKCLCTEDSGTEHWNAINEKTEGQHNHVLCQSQAISPSQGKGIYCQIQRREWKSNAQYFAQNIFARECDEEVPRFLSRVETLACMFCCLLLASDMTPAWILAVSFACLHTCTEALVGLEPTVSSTQYHSCS